MGSKQPFDFTKVNTIGATPKFGNKVKGFGEQ